MQNPNFKPWYLKVQESVQSLAEEFGLDGRGAAALKDFSMTLAKEQFKAGNSSGIAWARKNPPKTAGVVG